MFFLTQSHSNTGSGRKLFSSTGDIFIYQSPAALSDALTSFCTCLLSVYLCPDICRQPTSAPRLRLVITVDRVWRHGVVLAALGVPTKLLSVEPG